MASGEEEEVEIGYKENHFEDCLHLARVCIRERNYEGAIAIIEDSGLDLVVYNELGKLKHRCLTELGKFQEANDLLATKCAQIVLQFIRNAEFKEALQHIENSGLNINDHEQLLKLHDWCKSVLKEVPAVKQLLKEAHNYLKANDHQGALNLINNSKFHQEVHVNMMELKAHCLKKLGRDKDAFDVANHLWKHGYKMSRRLHTLIGDYLKDTEGSDVACNFYKKISDDPNVSQDDQQFYLKLVRDISGSSNKKKKKGRIAESSQAEKVKIEESQSQTIVAESEEKTRNEAALELDSALDGISGITLEEKKEMHDGIRGEGTDASGSTGESSKKIVVKDGYDFILEPQEEDLYLGHKKIESGYVFQMTLIRSTDFQIKNVEILKSLDHSNILKIADITSFNIEGTTSEFFVVESVKSVNHYFTSLLMEFRSNEHIVEGDDQEVVLRKWWKLIGPKFKKIFRDLVDGWIFFLSKGQGHVCSCDTFVTDYGRGKILPSMEPRCKVGDIVENLVKQMKVIVNLPHRSHNLKLEWLPEDLLHLFTFLSKEKANKVPLHWLLDHHFFWECEELVDFVYNLRRLYKSPELHHFRRFATLEMNKGFNKFWSECIKGGILWEIWSKGNPNLWEPVDPAQSAQLKASGWYKINPYQDARDIVRYMVAVYSHFDNDEYKEYNKGLNVADIEQLLRSTFPNIYGYFVNAIYQCVQDFGRDSQKLNFLRKLSRRRDY